MEVIKEFVKSVRNKYKTGTATEHSYRADLEKLVNDISKNKYQVLNEGRVNELKLGKPDLIIKKKDVLIGCIEAKDIDKNLANKDYEEQFNRYRNGIENLIITNCLDWEFYKDGKLKDRVAIGTLYGNDVRPDETQYNKLLLMLEEFTGYAGLKITSSKRLAEIMANRAKALKITILDILGNDTNKESLLSKQLEFFKENIMSDLAIESFSDMYAQTITYGLFAARLNDDTPETFSRQEAVSRVSRNYPLLKGLFKIFADDDIDENLNWDIENLIDVFRIVDLRKLFAENEKKDLFIHFYEDFLKLYDRELQKKHGVVYTPVQVVKYIVNAVDEVLQTEFNLKDGLADTSKTHYKYLQQIDTSNKKKAPREVYETKELDRLQILDPATGTGTFLIEVVRKIYEKYRNKQGLWSSYAEEHLLKNLHGFELLMTPYVMCHLKLSIVLKETGYEPKKNNRYNICLTNSLEKTEQTMTMFDWLDQETKLANIVKNDLPIKVVIGNPPYSVSSFNKSKFITDLTEVYKKGLGVENEKNIQPLSDDYLKFIRLAENYIERNNDGIVAFITNNSFLDGLIHRQMRKHLLETFDKIYIVNLHGNSRRNEKSPDGSKDENVFDIMTGVSINIFVKTSTNKDLAKVYYKDIYGLRNDKYDWLDNTKFSETDFIELTPKENNYFFVPKDFSIEDEYNKGFKIDELFKLNASGIKTQNDNASISLDKESIKQIEKDFKNLSIKELENKYGFQDARDWKISSAKNDVISNEILTDTINYRPFDTRYCLYTGKTKGIMGYPRHEVMQHFMKGANLGLCLMRNLTGTDIYNTVLVTQKISDINFYGYQTYTFPLYLYEEQPLLGCTKTPNFNQDILDLIKQKAGTDFTPENLLDYIYGILHSNKYREKYKELLKIDFPRVPYPEDKDYFFKIASYGEKLRNIHLFKTASSDGISYPQDGDNRVTTVKYKDNKVYINNTQYFGNVPQEVWDFYIGGYQPLQKWLKDRKKAGYTLTFDDIEHYMKMVNAISETISIMNEIDDITKGNV